MAKQDNSSTNPTADLLKRLSCAVGVGQFAGLNSIHGVVSTEMEPLVDRVHRDKMGSIIGVKQGKQAVENGQPRRKIMLAAHLDEIGAVVTKLDRGFLRFVEVGGLDNRVLMGQEVTVHGQRDLPGIIGSIPPHFSSAADRSKVDVTEMLIDVGLPSARLKKLVQVGDLVSFLREPAELLNGRLSGKSMDNRASIAAMVFCLREMKKMHHQWDVFAVATAGEEVGSYPGASTQAYTIRPDVALALDVTFADDDGVEMTLGKGPVFGLGPNNHGVLRQRLVDTCRILEMNFQSEPMSSGAGTDAFAIEISRAGIPTVLVAVPCRYMHTPVEMVDIKDVERTGRLLAQFIANLDEQFIEELIPKSE